MGLLDYLNQDSSVFGGLLGGLYYPGPLSKPEDVQQPQYDPMGNYTGITPAPASPFGPIPQSAMPSPSSFAPPSIFATGTAPIAGLPPSGGQPAQQSVPQIAASVPPQAPTDTSAQSVRPDRMVGVGDYQMPQFGSAPQPNPAAIPANAQPAQYAPSAAQATQPSFLGPQSPGIGDKLAAGLSGFGAGGKGGGLIGALTGGINGFTTGQSSDPRVIAQQNLKAQYDSLVPTLGPQKAMLAVLNPEAGKILLAQALEKKQYGFTKLDNDTVIRTDPATGKAEVAYGGQKSDTIAGPDGKLITMPEGADPKTWRNEITRINADVAAGKKTEVQAKSEIFANKMELSERAINDLAAQGTSLAGKIASGLPLGNYVQSPEYQRYKQAASNFITALLRQESGAAISKSEFERYDKEYMPQPGDGPEVLAQKAEARRVAIEGMKKGAGPGYRAPTGAAPANSFKTQTGVSWSVVK